MGDELVEHLDPRGEPYIWIGAQRLEDSTAKGTDIEAVYRGAVTYAASGGFDRPSHHVFAVRCVWAIVRTMKRQFLWATVASSLLAAGCDMALPPRIVPATPASTANTPSCSSPTPVLAGDTVYSVARRCGVSVRELIDSNHLQPPYALAPGSSLNMPGANAEIVVAKGDTLLVLARKNHVDFNSFAAANHKSSPYTIRVGEHLRLPGASLALAPAAPAAPSAPPSKTTIEFSTIAPAAKAGSIRCLAHAGSGAAHCGASFKVATFATTPIGGTQYAGSTTHAAT